MPLQPHRAWLDPGTETAWACELLRPCPSEWLEALPVTLAVNEVGYEGADCLERVGV